MRNITKIAFFSLLALSLASCGSIVIVNNKDIKTKVIDSKPYQGVTKILSESSVDIEYAQGPLSISVMAPEKLLDYIVVTRNNDMIQVFMNDNRHDGGIIGTRAVKLVVTAPDITNFHSVGSGDIILHGKISQSQINIEASGSGDIVVDNVTCNRFIATTAGSGDIDVNNIIADTLFATTSGSGDIKLEGKAKMAGVSTAGSGDINLKRFECPNLKAEANGSGEVYRNY